MNSNDRQKIVVFQQDGSGEKKIRGLRRYGGSRYQLEVIDIGAPLPSVIDDTRAFLPAHIDADLVLDFLKHPDLSQDLAEMCRDRGIPVVASGKKHRVEGAETPPT